MRFAIFDSLFDNSHEHLNEVKLLYCAVLSFRSTWHIIRLYSINIEWNISSQKALCFNWPK